MLTDSGVWSTIDALSKRFEEGDSESPTVGCALRMFGSGMAQVVKIALGHGVQDFCVELCGLLEALGPRPGWG